NTMRAVRCKKYTLLLMSAWILCACEKRELREWMPSDHGQPQAGEDDGRSAAPAAQVSNSGETAAQALWQLHCASCHGESGIGDGPGAPPSAALPDMTSSTWQSGRD